MNAAPPAHTRLRRAGRLAQIAGATDAEARELVAYALDDNERLTEELNALIEAHDELELERDEYAEKLRAAEEKEDAMQRNFAEALAAVGVDSPLPSVDDASSTEEMEVESVRAAVDAAVSRCPHLAFAERAFESADDSPFESPESILDALMKLEHVASRWARVGGIGGMDVGQAAIELGLDWKADVGDVAKRERHYAFVWNGEKRTMGPHVRLGGGSGAGRVARIYLDRYEPRDPTDRKLIVAHVGRKLPDSTTG